jgi:hypothetical protein
MSPEEKELLGKVAALSEENNDMLRGMQRSMRMASLGRWIYWILMIGAIVGAYYFVEPYLNQVIDLYNQAKGSFTNINVNTNGILDKLPKF